MAENDDKAQDAQDWKPVVEGLVKAIQLIASKVDMIDQSHGALEKLVTQDLIGGIHTMYQTNERNGRIESLKSKYGEHLNDHFEALKEFTPEGTDHWGALHDMTKGMEGEALDNHIKGLAAGLGAKFSKIRGSGAKAEVKELPPEEGAKVAGAVENLAKTTEKAAEKGKSVEEEPKKKSKDELIAERMKDSKGFKLR